MTVEIEPLVPSDVPTAVGGYANAVVVRGAARILFISGQIPEDSSGLVPDHAEAQCRLIWKHIVACLESADLTIANLAHVRTYLSDRSLSEVNSRVRRDILGSHTPALTVTICGIFDEKWLLEIEAIACA